MNTYLFKLGHQPKLSKAEILSHILLQDKDASFVIKDNNLLASTNLDIDCPKLNKQLGGTIYIAKKAEGVVNQAESLATYLNSYTSEGKITFSIHGESKPLALQVKKILKALGRSVRYVEIKNSATIVYNSLYKKGSDITIVGKEVFITESVQEINEFSKRDFKKPFFDSVSGMLPPKLARIMVNLAFSHQTNHKNIEDCILLDAFCGSGVVPLEGISLGCKEVLSSDNSEKAINDTQQNIIWYLNQVEESVETRVIYADATILSEYYPKNSIDIIASEPFMGMPLKGTENQDDLNMQLETLQDLYKKTIKEFNKVLKVGGAAVFIIPTFHHSLGDLVPNIGQLPKGLEYSTEFPSLSYHRKGQHITRVLHIFKKVA